jgi:hypothetical protein
MGRGRDLARLLCITPKTLTQFLVQRSVLYYFKDEEINGKRRALAVPIGPMRDLHERIKNLLCRIQLPDYLYSPRLGRSPVDNAELHGDSKEIVKLDIRQFYPSTTDEHVFQFFKHRMQMADDVAARITQLCTINGKVPLGSPVSPILCALVHDDVFKAAADKFASRGSRTSLWVDDLTVSGDSVRKSDLRDVRRLVGSKRMQTHKEFRAGRRNGAVVTGIHVSERGLAPANKNHVKMRDVLRELDQAADRGDALRATRSAIGRVNYFLQVYRENPAMTARLRARLAWLHNNRRALEALPAEISVESNDLQVQGDGLLPWG